MYGYAHKSASFDAPVLLVILMFSMAPLANYVVYPYYRRKFSSKLIWKGYTQNPLLPLKSEQWSCSHFQGTGGYS